MSERYARLDDYEPLVAELVLEIESAIKDGRCPAGLGPYAGYRAVAFWKHTTPSDLAFKVADYAVRATLRELAVRRRLVFDPAPPALHRPGCPTVNSPLAGPERCTCGTGPA